MDEYIDENYIHEREGLPWIEENAVIVMYLTMSDEYINEDKCIHIKIYVI